MTTPNIETIIRDRVTLTVDCIDRLYLNGYVPVSYTHLTLPTICSV